jgi:hypothetical protein
MKNTQMTVRRVGRAALLALAAGGLVAAAGCNLDVVTPQVVPTSATEGVTALPTLLAGAVGDFAVAYAGYNNSNSGEGIVLAGGLLADEFISTDYFSTHREIDTRNVTVSNSSNSAVLLHLMQALRSAQATAASYAANGQSNSSGRARALNLAGFVYTLVGENYCSGVPFSSIDASGRPVYGTSKSSSDMRAAAIAQHNDALAAATAANSSTQRYVAEVGKGRALLDDGQFAAAAAAVADVPVDFVFATEHGTVDDRTKNGIHTLTWLSTRFTTADNEGGNGLPFVSAQDPRVALQDLGTSAFDGSTELFAPLKYDSYSAPVPIATGVEAKLIIAEATYRGGNYLTALQQLNDLRATAGLTGLAPATTPAAQENQIFEERAFWLFGTAHRLGDLRRLIGQYGRTASAVFPTGTYFKGGPYGNQVALRVPQEEEQDNPNYSRAACDPTKP